MLLTLLLGAGGLLIVYAIGSALTREGHSDPVEEVLPR